MKPKEQIFPIKPIWFLIIALLTIPALLIHLGSLAFIEDEAIRSIVALEMLDTKNFFVPTINGDFYYAKPPLYNWILAASFSLFGIANEWTARLPNILILISFLYVIYWFTKPYLGQKWAFINALFFLTCGRILFWDSFLCLIDISYSLITYTSIICIFHFAESRNKQALIVYGLSGLAFLMKGFPSLLFPAISFSAYYLWTRNWKGIFHTSHVFGVALLGLIIGGYYLIYSQHNELDAAFETLLDQSTRRTVLRYSIKDVLLHIVSYPFENLYHFLPWSLLTFLLVYIKKVKEALSQKFIAFNAIMFLSNIIVYWVSPEVYPRYIIMLIPLYFTFFVYLLKLLIESGTKIKVIASRVSIGLLILILAALAYSSFNKEVQSIPNHLIWTVLAFVLVSSFLYLLWKQRVNFPIALVCALLVLRIWFNGVIIPTRVNNDLGSIVRTDAYRIAKEYPDFVLYGKSRMDRTSSFYLASNKFKANSRQKDLSKGNYFIYDTISYPDLSLKHLAIDSLRIREFDRMAYLIARD